MPEKLKAVKLVRRRFGDRVCVCGANAAPFSSACLLFGLTEALMMIHTDPELLKAACDFFVDVQVEWGLAQLDAGAHAIWLGDCNAMSNLISAEQYKRFAFEPCARVIEAYQKAGGLTFLHNSEEAVSHINIAAQSGASVISVGPGIDIGRAKEALRGKVCLAGNLDPIRVLMNGKPGDVAAEADRIVRVAGPGGGYIFNTGEMNPRDTPVENMRALLRGARNAAAPPR